MGRLNIPKGKTFVGPALIWKRMIAFFIDIMIIMLFILFPFRKLFQGIVPKEYSFSEAYKLLASTSYTSYIVSIYLASSALTFLYFYLLEKKMSQTIGKKLMNIYVVSNINNLKRWQLFVRNLVFVPIFPFDLLVILDPIFMFFTKTNQRLTEILSKTRVVASYDLEQ